MAIPSLLKPNHLKLYKDSVLLLIKYGQTDLAANSELKELLEQDKEFANGNGNGNGTNRHKDADGPSIVATGVPPKSEELALDLEKLGPTFVKIGELLAKRPEFLPLSYREALANLSARTSALEFSQIKEIVEVEIGLPLTRAFRSFDQTPLSVSALDQSHKAILTDGKRVVVKVQRPQVRQRVLDDLEALEEFARFYDQHKVLGKNFDYHTVLADFSKIILAELDLRQEAHNLKTLGENLKHLDLIIVPSTIERYSTARILTMTYIDGRKITTANNSGLLRSERSKLAEQVMFAYVQQILVDGFVDATPSEENVLLTSEGKVALVGMGIVARIAPAMQQKLIQLLLSINEARSEHTAEAAIEIGNKKENFDEVAFQQRVKDLVLAHRDMTINQGELGAILQGIAQAAVQCGLSLPAEVAMLAGALCNLDGIVHALDPKFDTNAFIHKNVAPIMQRHMREALSPAHFFHTVLETTEFIEKLPGQVGKILDSVANNELKVTVHAIDEQVLISGFQKIANRITVGLVLAALIMGAAMLMRVQSNFTIFGYPGLAILCFLGAAGCGFGLVVEIFLSDRGPR
jgi:ubiquinone biosynthesis protein